MMHQLVLRPHILLSFYANSQNFIAFKISRTIFSSEYVLDIVSGRNFFYLIYIKELTLMLITELNNNELTKRNYLGQGPKCGRGH